MKVILTENVPSVGSVGEIVNVSQGYGRNFLIPSKKAVLADEGSMKEFENNKKRLAKKIAEAKSAADTLGKAISGLTIEVTKRVGGDGKIFGTVTTNEISKELEKLGHVVEKRLINITAPIKTIGEFEVKIKLFEGVTSEIKVKVTMDPKQVEEMKKKQAAAEKAKAKKAEAAAAAAANATEETAETAESTEESTTEEA